MGQLEAVRHAHADIGQIVEAGPDDVAAQSLLQLDRMPSSPVHVARRDCHFHKP
jgi:hypothetical protein